MKKILLALCFVNVANLLHAEHGIFLNASNITTGTLINSALDNSSSTKQGNTFNGAGQLAQLDGTGKLPSAIVPGAVTSPGIYTSVIGPNATRNAQAVGTSSMPFISAFSSAAGVSQISGSTCIAPGSFYVQNGVYTIADTTIPYGVDLVCESSAVFKSDLSNTWNKTMFTIYGSVHGCNFDITEQNNIHNPILSFKPGSRFYNNKIINLSLNVQDSSTHMPFSFVGSTNVWFYQNSISNISLTGSGITGTIFDFTNSTNVFVFQNHFDNPVGYTGGNYLFHFKGGSNINVVENEGLVRSGIWFQEGAAGFKNGSINLSRNHWFVDNSAIPSNGVLLCQSGSNGNISTGTVIIGNTFELLATNNITRLFTMSAAAGQTFATLIKDNYVMATSPAGITGAFIGVLNAGNNNTALSGNFVYGLGTFLSDSGTGTTSVSHENYLNGAVQ